MEFSVICRTGGYSVITSYRINSYGDLEESYVRLPCATKDVPPVEWGPPDRGMLSDVVATLDLLKTYNGELEIDGKKLKYDSESTSVDQAYEALYSAAHKGLY